MKRIISAFLCFALIFCTFAAIPVSASGSTEHHLLLAGDFTSLGTWTVKADDTVFNGSYLQGNSLNTNTPGTQADATITVESAGSYTVWVHAKKNLSTATKRPDSAWKMGIAVDGTALGTDFGGIADSVGWFWDCESGVALTSGTHTISLLDNYGDWARCDAVLLVKDSSFTPADTYSELVAQLAELTDSESGDSGDSGNSGTGDTGDSGETEAADVIVVDNTDSDNVVLTGTWRATSQTGTSGWQGASTYRSGYIGENYYSLRNGDSEATFTWKFAPEKTGYYKVYINLPDGSDNAVSTSVTYELYSSDGSSNQYTVSHCQTAGYYLIGTCCLEASSTAVPVIKLVNVANSACMVDAAKIEFIGEELPVNKDSGKYVIDLSDPQQTILGLGVEIQSDSLDSGNTMNDTPHSVPHDLTDSEQQRLYTELLSGFRYLRLAGGLFYRGTDEEQKYLVERWDTQDEELAELISVSGIEGVNFEFWSPTPYFKSNGEYHGGTLKCFDESWEYYGDEEKTTEFLEEFADTIIYDFKRLEEAGIPITQFSLQNEPSLTSVYGTYSFCYYSDKDYYTACKVIFPKLKEAFPDIFIHANSWNGQQSGAASLIKADAELMQYIDGWSWHTVGYDSDYMITKQSYLTSGTEGLPVFNTEFEYQPYNFTGQYDYRFVNTAQAIMNWFTFENSNTWYWLHALKPLGNEESLGYSLGMWRKTGDTAAYSVGNDVEEGHWDYNYPNYNAIRGFLEFLDWDSVRYTVQEDMVRTDQRIMAWKNPAGQLAFAVTNRSSDTYFEYSVDTGLENAVFNGYRLTSDSEEMIYLGQKTGSEITTLTDPYSIEFWVEAETYNVTVIGRDGRTATIEAAEEAKIALADIAPFAYGYKITGWKDSDGNEITADTITVTADITLIPIFEVAEEYTGYTVTVEGASNTAGGTYQYNDRVTIVFDESRLSEGQYFGGWINSYTGAVISYAATYKFYVGADVSISASVTDAETTAAPVIAITDVCDMNGDGSRWSLLSERTVPSGYTYINSGFIYNTAEMTDLASADNRVKMSQSTAKNGQFRLTLNLATATEVYVVAYLTYEDADGTRYIVYSNSGIPAYCKKN